MVLHDFCDGSLRDAAAEEQDRANGGRAKADTKIGIIYDAEVKGVNAEFFKYGEENRGENQDGGGHIHKTAHDEQKQVYDKQNHDFAFGESEQKCA